MLDIRLIFLARLRLLRRAALGAFSACSKQLSLSARSRSNAVVAPARHLAHRAFALGPHQRRFNSGDALSDSFATATSADSTSASNDPAEAMGASPDASEGLAASRRPVTKPPFMNIPPNKQVYVGNLFFNVTEQDLQAHMSRFGPIESVKILYDARGMSKGFAPPPGMPSEAGPRELKAPDANGSSDSMGFVNFESLESANRAIYEMNGHFFEGRPVVVHYARTPGQGGDSDVPRNPPSRSIFIGNLSFDLTDRDLNNLFSSVENVMDVRVAVDRRTGQPRGFAHADFTDVESAVKAAEQLRGKILFGRALRIDYSREGPVRFRAARDAVAATEALKEGDGERSGR